MTQGHCIEVFARGLAFTRTFSRPYLASAMNALGWWLRDAPEYKQRRRNDEWIVDASSEPKVIDRQARDRAEGGFLINVVSTTPSEKEYLRSTYRELGYRLWRTEWLMRRKTVKSAKTIDPEVTISIIDSEETASRLAKVARGRLILPVHLKGKPMPVRCHVASVEAQIIGWARSVSVGSSSWFASLFVQPQFRRRGVGSALVAATLHADGAAGLTDSVLVASHAGAKLYATAGYQTAAEVLVFVPHRQF